MAKLTLKKYIELSKTINCLDDLMLNNASLIDTF